MLTMTIDFAKNDVIDFIDTSGMTMRYSYRALTTDII